MFALPARNRWESETSNGEFDKILRRAIWKNYVVLKLNLAGFEE